MINVYLISIAVLTLITTIFMDFCRIEAGSTISDFLMVCKWKNINTGPCVVGFWQRVRERGPLFASIYDYISSWYRGATSKTDRCTSKIPNRIKALEIYLYPLSHGSHNVNGIESFVLLLGLLKSENFVSSFENVWNFINFLGVIFKS